MSAQLPLPLAYAQGSGEADFFVSPCNAKAVAWLDHFPGWGHHATLLLGPEGSGKSHLAAIFRARHGAQVDVWDRPIAAGDEVNLFHRYNAAREAGRGLLILSREVPGPALPDLASRLAACPVIRIEPPDDEALGALLLKAGRDRGLALAPDVLRYCLARMERSFAAAQQLAADLDRLGLASRRDVTVKLAAQALAGNHTDG
jgi:chromosomal replication initiation ATPase DnaA